jgi:hypothetical protein
MTEEKSEGKTKQKESRMRIPLYTDCFGFFTMFSTQVESQLTFDFFTLLLLSLLYAASFLCIVILAAARADTAHAQHAQQTAALSASEAHATAALAAAQTETTRLCSGTWIG